MICECVCKMKRNLFSSQKQGLWKFYIYLRNIIFTILVNVQLCNWKCVRWIIRLMWQEQTTWFDCVFAQEIGTTIKLYNRIWKSHEFITRSEFDCTEYTSHIRLSFNHAFYWNCTDFHSFTTVVLPFTYLIHEWPSYIGILLFLCLFRKSVLAPNCHL